MPLVSCPLSLCRHHVLWVCVCPLCPMSCACVAFSLRVFSAFPLLPLLAYISVLLCCLSHARSHCVRTICGGSVSAHCLIRCGSDSFSLRVLTALPLLPLLIRAPQQPSIVTSSGVLFHCTPALSASLTLVRVRSHAPAMVSIRGKNLDSWIVKRLSVARALRVGHVFGFYLSNMASLVVRYSRAQREISAPLQRKRRIQITSFNLNFLIDTVTVSVPFLTPTRRRTDHATGHRCAFPPDAIQCGPYRMLVHRPSQAGVARPLD